MSDLASLLPVSCAEMAPTNIELAIARFGAPGLHHVHLDVTAETLAYWARVRTKRVAEVVMLLRRTNGRYLVHTKAFYPQGVYRLISGGIKAGEDLVEAVHREVSEETRLQVRIERFLAVFQFVFQHGLERQPFTSYLFWVDEVGGSLAVGDPAEAITGFREISLADLGAVADNLEALSPDWNDWGRFRAIPHRLALTMLEGSDPAKGGEA